MARLSNKSLAEISTQRPHPLPSPLVAAQTSTQVSSSRNDDNEYDLLLLLERKVILATEDLTTAKFCELVLRDRHTI
jgi:hypothetical protein